MTRITNGPLSAALALAIWAVCVLTSACGQVASGTSEIMQPGTPDEKVIAFTELGKARLLQGDLAGALSELSKAETINPKNIDTLNLLGLTYYTRKDYEKAIGYFNRVLTLDPSKSDVRNNLGLVYLDMREYDQAKREFEKCLEDPVYGRSFLALYNLGVLAEGQGRASDAETIYQNVIMINPQYAPPLLRLASMKFAAED